tara:strand:+ start:82 stop:282 length:201 start_codon:yes stop_codon:yes gene_type:complete
LKDVINRVTIPTDPEEKSVYSSEWLVAVVLTQTYGYMIENGRDFVVIKKDEKERANDERRHFLVLR